MYLTLDEAEWETVIRSMPCTACDGPFSSGSRKCNGQCNGSSGVSMVRRSADDVMRIKRERMIREEDEILAKADEIRARRGTST